MTRESCKFCLIADGKDEKTTLVYQDEMVIVFKDIRPASKHHYLVCPRKHIKDAKVLTKDDLPLVETMVAVGKQCLEDQGGDVTQARFGFHWPPFHFVSHLHLHVISPEADMGFMSRQMYRPNSWWFVTVEWLKDRLEKLPISST